MDIMQWQIALAPLVSAAVAWGLSRWWYRRYARLLRRQMLKLETSQQTAERLGSQARKQVEDLQRLVAEYRRRLTSAEEARRATATRSAVVTAEVNDKAERAERASPVAAAASAPRLPPGGWADTQPM